MVRISTDRTLRRHRGAEDESASPMGVWSCVRTDAGPLDLDVRAGDSRHN
jgi:hypothetical protein